MNELVARLGLTRTWERPARGRPLRVDLHRAVTIVLVYLRRNLAQAAIAELFGVSQSTVSRLIATPEGPIEAALASHVPTTADLATSAEQLVLFIDGTLTPCWSYQDHPELFSGKHHTTGHNHQVACSVDGELIWVSDPLPGSTHDKAAWDHHHIDAHVDVTQVIADKGYQGTGAITPTKKPVGGELTRSDHKRNERINKLRWVIEQANAHIKPARVCLTNGVTGPRDLEVSWLLR
jgi:DDE superfamily endonuclease/Helix-turn-helix of DDE superfamily endonuclease